jgi:hypothetical protein
MIPIFHSDMRNVASQYEPAPSLKNGKWFRMERDITLAMHRNHWKSWDGMDDLAKTNLLAYHIFTEPDPSSGINIDADADTMQGSTEKVDTVPASERLLSHTLLHGIDPGPGCRKRPCSTNTFSAVAQACEAFISDALIRRAAIRTGMAESAVRHVPAMQKRSGGQGVIPGKRSEPTGGTFVIYQLEELLGELLSLS